MGDKVRDPRSPCMSRQLDCRVRIDALSDYVECR